MSQVWETNRTALKELEVTNEEQDKKILELVLTLLHEEGMPVEDILDPEVEKLIIGKDSPELI